MVPPPEWLAGFVNEIIQNIYSRDFLAPLGCHFQEVNDVWEITVFASSTEIVGGSQDGRRVHSNFSLDVKKLLELFSHVDEAAWQSQAIDRSDELGPHLAVEGIRDGKQIWLRITSMAPQRFAAGRRAMVNQGQIEELW